MTTNRFAAIKNSTTTKSSASTNYFTIKSLCYLN